MAERAAQQSVRLPGDYLHSSGVLQEQGQGAGVDPAAAATVDQWQRAGELVVQPAVRHSSALLRAAAHAVIAALSPAAAERLPPPLLRQLLGWCCGAAANDEASPVRAAAAKAVGAVASAPALCALPGGECCTRAFWCAC